MYVEGMVRYTSQSLALDSLLMWAVGQPLTTPCTSTS